MASHNTLMEQIGRLDQWIGRCSCGYEAGPGKASEVGTALNRHLQNVGVR